ncbi:MAG: hypothetical protein JWQ18_2020 [Conexibacter sp.]|nr:hypothetical protein [Conexibacter sp.]
MARVAALAVTAALAGVLSLSWFALDAPLSTQRPDPDGGGILNLLNQYDELHASGRGGLGWLPLALLGLAAAGTLAGLAREAVAVGAVALVVLVVVLATEDDLVVLRWPAYAGVALSAALLGCAVWSWRTRVGLQA